MNDPNAEDAGIADNLAEVDLAEQSIVTSDTLANGINDSALIAADSLISNEPALSPAIVDVNVAIPSPSVVNTPPPVTVAEGATAEIAGISARSVTFEGTTGTLKLEDAVGFTGQVSGLAGSDAIDLADVSYGAATTATFLGNTTGGTLTITDGTNTANIALQGDYLSSSWDLSGDGSGGTVVVDPVSTNTWQALPVGAGGFLDGFSVADNGTMVVRTDTYGAYIWNGTEWQQLITATSMPAAFVANAQLYSQGALELQIAPSNSSVLYMVYAVYEPNTYPPLEGVYKSTNEGATWTLTSFTPIADTTMNANGPYRMWGQNMAVDPINPNIVYVGTGANGLFVTTDGGNTWTSVSGVPTATSDSNGNYPGITGILFDPANTNVVFAASYGNGVYETTNGGTSWSKLSAGPSSVEQAAISSNGTYFAIDASNNLWVYAHGTWTETLSGVVGVAVDPFNPNHVVATQSDGQLDESFNSGTIWGGWSQQPTDVANDIPYQAIFGTNAEGLAFDPATPGVLYINGNRSFWTTTLSGNITTSTVPTWTDQGIGVEQLCANEIIVAPVANSTPLEASWDTAVIAPNGSNYASTYGPVANGAVVAGWSIDYASSDPNFIVVLADGGYAGGPQESGYSTNDGQTWNPFPTLPPGGSFGGDIAASTPENIIFASANGVQPYYTLNGGETWNPISLPGVSSWSGFVGPYFDDNQVITADRVLANTFYLLFNGVGVFETTNGGVNWTEVNSNVTSGHQILSTPGEAGDLWLVSGTSGNPGNQGPENVGGSLLHSTNGGATWTTIANVAEPYCMGFGAAAPGQSYPALYMVGWVNGVYGVWQSINEAQSWTSIGTWPNGNLDTITTISGDPNVFGKVYIGLAGGGYQVFSADGPSVLEIDTSPSSGSGQIGTIVTLKLAMSEVTTVSGGTPTLTLNDGGSAAYVGGSGTDALTFSYTAAAGQNTSALAATAINLNGATLTDSGGNSANLSLTGLSQTGPQIDTAVATVTAVANSVTSGVLEPGAPTTLTLNMSEVITVNTSGGSPTLTLNDGGVATYTGGSGTDALTFSYTAAAGQNASSLAATAVNLNGATIANANGGANLSLSGLTQSGPQVDGTSTLAVDGTGFSGLYASATSANVALTTANPNDVIILNIAYNGPAIASISDTAGLTWQERAVAGSSGSQIYQYYAIAPNALAADSITVNFAGTADYYALDAFGIVGANTSSPFDTNASVPGTSNGSTVSATTSNADDLIFAAYRFYSSNPTAGSGWNTIDGGSYGYLSEYQVASVTQTGLVATASSGENGDIIDAVVAATAPTGPIVSSVVVSPSSGDLNSGKAVTLTLDMSEAVTVNTSGGTPTLTLNDGATATYASGSGSSALVFTYTIAAGQNTAALAATALNLNGATITDGSGNAANPSLSGLSEAGPQIDTTTPTVTALSESPSSGDLDAGKVVTITLTMSEVVTVNTSGGTPTLTLNDGGTASYASGSGSNALTFSYTVLAGQNTSDLMETAVNLNGATITDGAGNAANLSLAGLPQGSPQIDTTPPTVASLTQSPSSGDLNAGKTVTLTLTFSEAVLASNAAPTLTLNDGGTASYAGGSGTNTLTFSYTVAAGQITPSLAATAINLNSGSITDGAGNAANLSLSGISQTGPQIDASVPTISSLTESPSTGDLNAGKTVTFTLNLNEAVTVAGGTPTLTLNDGSSATYTGGSGTSALTFSYTVGAGQNVASLAATAINLNAATIKDGAGNAASLSLTGLTQTGPQIDTTTPTISSLTETPSTGDLNAGKSVTFTLNLNEAVTVAGGTPTLTLNDGSSATYTGGSGSNALTFSYTVGAGQNVASLAATAINFNAATVEDGAGNAASLSLTGLTQTGPQIDTTTPTISSLTETPSTGDLNAGKTVTFTLNLNEAVTVAGGTPTLTLNDGGSATYTGGSGTTALTFSYAVGAGQNVASLAATAINLNSATVADGAGNVANLSLTGLTQTGPQIDTTTPAISSLTETPSSGDLDAGKTVTFTLNLNEAVTVAGGTPTLTLNDGSSATYTGGSGTTALTFSYAVGAGQNVASLAATAINLNAATIKDGAGNAAGLSLTGLTQTGPQIDTTTPTISSLTETPSTGDLDAGKTVTFTLNLNEAVTVAGGTPTLTLNDGGVASYTSGSGTNALTFSYTVGAGQNNASLAATALNLNSASIKDAAGNAANLSLTGLTQTGAQVDTTAPTISSLTETPSSGDLDASKVVAITLTMSEAVTVNTSGGTPTLTLNDGGTASYVSGSGTTALTFSYTVAPGQNTPDLMETAVNLNGGTIIDAAGNAANLSLVGLPQGSPQIDTTTPTISLLTETPSSGDLNAGKTVTLTLTLSEAVTVSGGTPTLTLNDGGSATYTGGSGTTALTFSYTVGAGQNVASLAATAINLNSATVADGAGNVANLSLTGLTQTGPQIDTTTPTISSLTETPSSGDLNAGKTVTFTLDLNETVTVAGGTPTLTLNDGGSATYTGGSGTNALIFSYTVAAGQNTASLQATAVNFNAATVKDGAGNVANLSLSGLTQTGPQIDATTPTISSLTETPSSGDLNAGNTVTLTLNLNEAVTVAGGTPTLTLNDGGIATYTGGSGTNTLTFSYTVGAGQNTANLQATAVTLNGASIKDGAGNAANLSLTGLTQTGPQIDTTTPTISSLTETPSTGDLDAGKTVTLTLNLNEAVTVAGGTPTLTLNDGGSATYAGGSGTNALTFNYTIGAGQSVANLAATAINLNSASVTDGAGNAATLSLTGLTQTGPQIDTTTPTIASVTKSTSSGDPNFANSITFTLNLNEAVTIAGGRPTLILNNGASASYVSGSGTNALTFRYAFGVGQNIAALAATAVNLNLATVTDAAGNGANLALPGVTTGPSITSLTETPSSGDLDAGKVITITLAMSEAVTVAGGTPTLTLNDGGIASYVSGAGTNALTFSYTVAQGQNTPDLMETAVNLNGASITDSTGNAANVSLAGLSQSGPQIDTTAPTISSLSESPSHGSLRAGKVVAITLNMSEAVTVNTSGGTPTLTLNDGGVASYVSGSGTNALTFSYTVLQGQNTPDLMETVISLNGATITDAAGNIANLSLAGVAQGSPAIDTTPPTISSLTDTPSSGDLSAGQVVTITLGMSEAVTVDTSAGTPTLTLNDGGTATYAGGSGTNALTFSYTVQAGQNTSDLMETAVNLNGAIITDAAGNIANLALAGLTQAGPQIDGATPTGPTVLSLTESTTGGDPNFGPSVTFTLNLSEAATIAGGRPTLILNNGGSASYVSGSGTNALIFSYAVGAGQNITGLAALAVGLNSATVTDAAGNAADLALPGVTTGPSITSLTDTPSSGDLNAGDTVALTLNLSEAVTVAGGTPTMMLNDGGTATYTGGSGTNALTFSYTVGAGQNIASLAATAINLNFASVTDGAGNVANLSLAGIPQTGPQVDTTTPIVSSVVASGTGISGGSGDLNAGKTVTLTLNMSEAVTITGGTPTLSLNDGGVASYVGGSGTNALTFSYTVGAGQTTPDLAVTAVNLNFATVTDAAGNVANLNGAVTNPAGTLQIDTAAPAISSLNETPSSGDLNVGNSVIFTLNLNEAVTVAGGAPTLTLNDGGTAAYIGGSSTNALTFIYTVAAGQNTASLQATAVNLNTAAIDDGAGNAANLSLTGLTQTGPQIGTVTSTTPTLVASGPGISGGSGDLNAGETVTLTLNLSEAVTVAGGTPTLILNDGGTAAYTGGSGTNALAFSYTVAPGQNTPDLAVTTVNLNSATITDGSGNNASLGGPLTLTGTLQIDTATPTISSLTESSSSGDPNLGNSLTFTLDLNEAVTVAGGRPTLILNNGGSASYVSGSGTDALTFRYAVAAGQNIASLAATAVDLNSATVTDGAGNAANLSLNGVTQSGPQIGDVTLTTATIAQGATLELTGGYAGTVTFDSPTGTLQLDSPSSFSGQIVNFTGNGTLSGSDQIDLTGFNYSSIHDSYSNGTLTVTNVNQSVALNFSGAHVLANFDFASDGNGGTIVYDPPVSSPATPGGGPADLGVSNVLGNLPNSDPEQATVASRTAGIDMGASFPGATNLNALTFDAPATLGYSSGASALQPPTDGYLGAATALMRNYMASTFPTSGSIDTGALGSPPPSALAADRWQLAVNHHA